MRIGDGDSSDPGWKKVGSGIRDKLPGSATLVLMNIQRNLRSEVRTLTFTYVAMPLICSGTFLHTSCANGSWECLPCNFDKD
jgi:hypothetical protein